MIGFPCNDVCVGLQSDSPVLSLQVTLQFGLTEVLQLIDSGRNRRLLRLTVIRYQVLSQNTN